MVVFMVDYLLPAELRGVFASLRRRS